MKEQRDTLVYELDSVQQWARVLFPVCALVLVTVDALTFRTQVTEIFKCLMKTGVVKNNAPGGWPLAYTVSGNHQTLASKDRLLLITNILIPTCQMLLQKNGSGYSIAVTPRHSGQFGVCPWIRAAEADMLISLANRAASRLRTPGFGFSRLALVATDGDLLGRASMGFSPLEFWASAMTCWQQAPVPLTMARSRRRGFTSNSRQQQGGADTGV